MNGATILISLILVFLYGLAVRHVCKNGACSDCGLQGACPIHKLRAKPLHNRPDLETIRRQSPRPDIRVTIRR